MKRVVEKVKDIVEICPFTHLHDFSADPGKTLAGYHFTDITADLMSKWIDRVVNVRPGHGTACALAGFRGVGKSHFLSVLGSMIERPELRSKITDSHVSSAAERLSRRHGNVAFVRRGTSVTLIDEFKRAISPIVNKNPADLSDSLYDLLMTASDHSGDVPLVILIDTALGRDSRVARDDGKVLSDFAEAAKAIGVFVGVALDDDISEADGPNASISRSFSIDYLDQEHLYKVVDSVIFSKHNHMRGVLQEIYEDYRRNLPGFRWSEQRFTLLYPLHPATVEIAPLIRLYIHDFALLGFAAEAGVKILGRPANSLIGLDEVFDSVEQKLRAVGDLKEVFDAFDHLERDVIGRMPVHVRLPAKLILKGLLILSLAGQGATAGEIAASMMISEGESSPSIRLNVDELLESFFAELPNSVERSSREGYPTKYCLRIASKIDIESILRTAAEEVPDDIVWNTLLAITADKWSDFSRGNQISSCSVEWRGSIRRGELIWPPSNDQDEPLRDRKENPDWSIRVDTGADTPSSDNADTTAIWRIGRPTVEDSFAVKRHFVLVNDPDIRTKFGDSLATALHVSSIALEKIWNRIFFADGFLYTGNAQFRFDEVSRSANSIGGALSSGLAPVFESLYPTHPEFKETLALKQVADLISTFFSGSGVSNAETQKLAESFAFPLSLAELNGDLLVPLQAEKLAEHHLVKVISEDMPEDGPLPLRDIASRLSSAPYGLTRESQHVFLAALVGQKLFDFVTSSGNRINYRSLDLQIIWDDIEGLARPLNEQYSAGRLLAWAKIVTGNAALSSIDRAEDRELIVDSLAGWLSGWNQSKVLRDFDELPDENLSANIWRTAANLRKSFGAMADIIDSLVKKELTLEQCLQFIADLFSDSEAEYEAKKLDLRVLRDFTSGVKLRSDIRSYLTLCESTNDEVLESSRNQLLVAMADGRSEAVNKVGEDFVAVWNSFKELYSSYYAERHDAVMRAERSDERLRSIIRSDAWTVFESLSTIKWLEHSHFDRARGLVREMRQLQCDMNVLSALSVRPFCGCSFSLAETDRLMGLPNELESTISRGLEDYVHAIMSNQDALIAAGETEAMKSSVTALISAIDQNGLTSLSSQDVRILKLVAARVCDEISTDFSVRSEMLVEQFNDENPGWEAEINRVEEFVNSEI